jgi:rhodanese-related sulfurtransferase
MVRILPWISVVVLIGTALAVGLQGKARRADDVRLGATDQRRVAELLSDRDRPWWKGHRLTLPATQTIVYGPPEKMGAWPDPPPGCPVMPVELARALMSGAPIPSDHPLAGRRVLVVDMRIRSRHLMEHIPDSVNIPYSRMYESLESGELHGTDPKTLVLLYGDVYPHFEATAPFRVAKFEAYYCLEGGLRGWKEKGYPVVADASVAEYLKALDSEKVVGGAPAAPDPADIGPAGLKALLDQGVEPLIVFVGDANTYNSGRIPGAIHVTLEEVQARFEKEPRDRLIAVYCGCCEGSAKGLSGQAVERLRGMKFTRLLHLNGHLKAWKDQGYPLLRN